MDAINRRELIKRSFGAAAALGVPMLAAQAWGETAGSADSARPIRAESSGALGANDDIRIAVIGFNGRGKTHIDEWRKIKGVRLVALCDADEAVLHKMGDQLNKSIASPATRPSAHDQPLPDKATKVQLYTDVRKLLDDKNIDAISIATPNHWHSLMAIWGIQAGKDVYVEKPTSHNVWEGFQLVEAAKKHNKIVQAGTQSRSRHSIRDALQWVRAGHIGKIKVARGLCYKRRGSIGKTQGPQPIPKSVDYDLWCGPAPKGPLRREKLHYDWHWFWDNGNGDLGNQGIHQMDIVRWALGKETLSPRVFSVGGRFGYVDDGQTPNTLFVVHDYGDAQIIFEVRGLWDSAGTATMSKYKGQDIGQVIECEGGYLAGTTAYDHAGKQMKTFTAPAEDHFANFIKGVRSRKAADLNAPIVEGNLSSALCHTGNISYRLGQRAKPNEIYDQVRSDAAALETYDRFIEHLANNDVGIVADKATLGPILKMDPQTQRFIDNADANNLLRDPYRAPFVVPEEV